MKIDEIMLNRRQALLATFGSAAALGLAGCGGTDAGTDAGSAAAAGSAEEPEVVAVDAAAYDALIATGEVADDATIEASEWAKAVKDAGALRVGGTRTSTLFSLEDPDDGSIRGFDSGLYQLLTRYILGDESKYELTQVTSDTRESVLQNGEVDAVFATYTINEERAKVISFAGPYYNSRYSVLVLESNTDIDGIDSLAGKTVAVQSGSTGPSIMEEFAPDATLEEFSTDEEARAALEDGRVDAYVFDDSMNLGSIVKNPGKYKTVGGLFGPDDLYGIGLPLDSDGVAFVNDFLKKVEDAGLWEELWNVTIGARTGVDTAPEPPAIEA